MDIYSDPPSLLLHGFLFLCLTVEKEKAIPKLMASSRIMASCSSATSNIVRQSSIHSLKSLGCINIDDLFPAIESDGDGCDTSSATISRQGSVGIAGKVEEVWSEIEDVGVGGEMTLEDFLARDGGFGMGPAGVLDPIKRRGRKRDSTMDPVEKAALQRQKRMIKNRESAARSRERKQAYTAELESIVAKLEEENAQLLRHQEERNKKRLKQLVECVIPITEQRKPKLRKTLHMLQRSHSMEW